MFECEYAVKSLIIPNSVKCKKTTYCKYELGFGSGKYCKIPFQKELAKGELEKKLSQTNSFRKEK